MLAVRGSPSAGPAVATPSPFSHDGRLAMAFLVTRQAEVPPPNPAMLRPRGRVVPVGGCRRTVKRLGRPVVWQPVV